STSDRLSSSKVTCHFLAPLSKVSPGFWTHLSGSAAKVDAEHRMATTTARTIRISSTSLFITISPHHPVIAAVARDVAEVGIQLTVETGVARKAKLRTVCGEGERGCPRVGLGVVGEDARGLATHLNHDHNVEARVVLVERTIRIHGLGRVPLGLQLDPGVAL